MIVVVTIRTGILFVRLSSRAEYRYSKRSPKIRSIFKQRTLPSYLAFAISTDRDGREPLPAFCRSCVTVGRGLSSIILLPQMANSTRLLTQIVEVGSYSHADRKTNAIVYVTQASQEALKWSVR
jgi:hypothetical protein